MSPQASVNSTPRALPNTRRRGPARGLVAAAALAVGLVSAGPALTVSAAAAQNAGSAPISDAVRAKIQPAVDAIAAN